MNITVYYPETEEGRKKLSEKASEFMADKIMERINDLFLPKEEKEKILKMVIDELGKSST